jgi:hypothetical protein
MDLMELHWAKDRLDEWWLLDDLRLTHVHGRGVYVLWRGDAGPSAPSRVIKVGLGNLALEVSLDRMNPAINPDGARVFVTWAEVADAYASGVHAYLVQSLSPALQGPSDRVPPILVNLPLSA